MSLDFTAKWDSLPLAVFDLETSGLNTKQCGAVSVACVRFEGGQVVDKFYSLVNPGVDIDEGAAAIHGLRYEQVKNAPTLPELAGDLLRVSAGAVPAGYNSQSFDRPVLHRFITGKDCPLFDPDFPFWLDVLVLVRHVDARVSGAGRHKLERTCERWQIDIGEAHNALADCIASGRLLFTMLERGAKNGGIDSCSLGSMLKTLEQRNAYQKADFTRWAFGKFMERANVDQMEQAIGLFLAESA